MRPRLDAYKIAQNLLTLVKTRKFAVVKDVIEDLKASISHKVFNAAWVHP